MHICSPVVLHYHTINILKNLKPHHVSKVMPDVSAKLTRDCIYALFV